MTARKREAARLTARSEPTRRWPGIWLLRRGGVGFRSMVHFCSHRRFSIGAWVGGAGEQTSAGDMLMGDRHDGDYSGNWRARATKVFLSPLGGVFPETVADAWVSRRTQRRGERGSKRPRGSERPDTRAIMAGASGAAVRLPTPRSVLSCTHAEANTCGGEHMPHPDRTEGLV